MSFENFSQRNLEDLLKAGASLELNANVRSQHNLEDLARSAKFGGATLTLARASGISQHNLEIIARVGEGRVAFKD